MLQKIKHLESTKEKGNEAYRKGKYEEAFDLYTEALAIDPCNKKTNAKLHSNRSNVCEKVIQTCTAHGLYVVGSLGHE